MSIGITIKLAVPSVPNFIFPEEGTVGRRQDGIKESLKFDIADISDEALSRLADQWKSALLLKAAQRRLEKMK